MASGFKIKAEVKNSKELTNFSSPELKAMDAALTKTEEIIHSHFDAYQGKWTPLAPATIKERIALGFGPTPILVRTGHLRDEGAVQGMEVFNNGLGGDVFTQDEIAIIQDETRSFYEMESQDLDDIVNAYFLAFKKEWSKTS